MFLEEDKIDAVVKKLNFEIIAKNLLISKYPIYALAQQKDKIAVIEILQSSDSNFISEHILWLDSNMRHFLDKYNLKQIEEFNLICFYFGNEKIDFKFPGLVKKLEVYSFKNTTPKGVGLESFYNYTLNFYLLEELLGKFLDKYDSAGFKKYLVDIITQKPLICKKLADNSVLIETRKDNYYLYFFRDFLWFQKGKSPFRPQKILFSSFKLQR